MAFSANSYGKKLPLEGTSLSSQNIFDFKAISQAST